MELQKHEVSVFYLRKFNPNILGENSNLLSNRVGPEEANSKSQEQPKWTASRVLDVDPSKEAFIWRKQKIFGPLAGVAALVIITVGCLLFVYLPKPTEDSISSKNTNFQSE